VVVGASAPAPVPPGTGNPLEALEAAVLPALQRAPCLVSFSGGLDSSLVLAVAARAARRAGLPDPVPCTWRVAGAPAAEESGWQHEVVRTLDIAEWQVLQTEDDLDLIGPVASRLLARHDVQHPANLHLHLPLVELAAGGSLLTGVGGDQVLSGWRRPAHHTWSRRWKNRVPAPWRAVGHQLRDRPLPWLRPHLEHRVWSAHLAELAAEPVRTVERVPWHARRRSLRLGTAALGRLADDHDVRLVNPLLDHGFVAALARLGGDRPAASRLETIAAVAGDALPAVVHRSRPKARFREVFFREPTRQFVRSWDGTGVDPALVDLAALRRLWSAWPVPPGTAGLVQQAYRASGALPARTSSQSPQRRK
jgi:hypothetical protein